MKKAKRSGGRLVFRRYRTDKRTGKVYDAHDYGLTAWPMRFGRATVKGKTATAVAV